MQDHCYKTTVNETYLAFGVAADGRKIILVGQLGPDKDAELVFNAEDLQELVLDLADFWKHLRPWVKDGGTPGQLSLFDQDDIIDAAEEAVKTDT